MLGCAEPPAPAGITAAARIVAEPDGRGGTALPVLHSDGPFALHRSRTTGPDAEVAVIGAMSAPLGGDQLSLDVTAMAGARLRLSTSAATLALPGRRRDRASYRLRLTAGEGAVLRWLPEPLVSAAGSDLVATTLVRLHRGARLVLRERLILGRTGEQPGRLLSRLTVRYDGRLLLDQELSVGAGAPGWSGPAVLGDYRAVGQLLVVDPALPPDGPPVLLPPHGSAESRAVLTPLPGPAVLVTALGPDALRVQDLLDLSLTACPEWTRADAGTS